MGELISFDHYLAILEQPALMEACSPLLGKPYLLVDLEGAKASSARSLPSCPVIGIDVGAENPASELVDLLIDEPRLTDLLKRIEAQPLAAATLVQLLRHNAQASVNHGLFAESLCYSSLQQSRGFQTWLHTATRPERKEDPEPLLLVSAEASTLTLTLNRPHAHNAYSSALKDALCAALHAACADESLTTLILRGNGPSFCAGGDLAEFGQVTDAAEAHLSRTTRGAGMLLAHLNADTQVHVHGACIGAGIEIPAFADRIIASAGSFFQLPEIAMGLVPGAGGTVSITRRIGRHRTAYMAISNQRIDTPTALAWGLIDAID